MPRSLRGVSTRILAARLAGGTLVLAALLGLGDGGGGVAPRTGEPRILVFSKTAGFRHASIPDGIKALRELAVVPVRDGARDQIRFAVDATEDSEAFTSSNLARYAAVVFLSTTGDILNDSQQAAFEGFIRGGGGFVGIHAASDTEFDWPWYGRLVGAYFKGHPDIQPADVVLEDRTHPSTAMLPARWTRTDEWYAFQENPRQKVRVLARLDESSYQPGALAMGDHPIAWWQEFDGGRAWYTAGGHTSESFSEELFRAHLLGGILWAAGLVEAKPAVVPDPGQPIDQPASPPPAPPPDPTKSTPLSHPAPE